jgi:hypothetical protein
VSFSDIAFPYKRQRPFGIVSFSFVFTILVLEIEAVVFVGLGLIANQIALFLELQPEILPAAVLVSLAAGAVFAWRARAWTKARIEGLRAWDGAVTSSYGDKLAARTAV